MLTTKLSCPCGRTLDVGLAVPGESVECPDCLRRVAVPARPPGIGTPWQSPAAVDDDDEPTYELPPEPPLPDLSDPDEIAAGFVPAAPPPPPEYVARGAVASNPARTCVEYLRYYRAFPAQIAITLILIALGSLGAVLYHPAVVTLAVIGLFLFVLDVLKVGHKFRTGDACPAVVLSESPPLVAVHADLATGGSPPRRAIRILRQPIRHHAAGTRLAAVSVYQLPVRNGTWAGFDPQVLRCVTTDEVDVQRVTSSIGEQDWQALEQAISQLPTRKPGLHTLWDDNAHGRRTNRRRLITDTLILLTLVLGSVFLVMYGKLPKSTLPADSVPGRVHSDWGR